LFQTLDAVDFLRSPLVRAGQEDYQGRAILTLRVRRPVPAAREDLVVPVAVEADLVGREADSRAVLAVVDLAAAAAVVEEADAAVPVRAADLGKDAVRRAGQGKSADWLAIDAAVRIRFAGKCFSALRIRR